MNNSNHEVVSATFEKIAARRMDKYIKEVAKLDPKAGARASKQINKAVDAIGKTKDPLAQRAAEGTRLKQEVADYVSNVKRGGARDNQPPTTAKNVYDATKNMIADTTAKNKKALEGPKIANKSGKMVNSKPVDTVNRAYLKTTQRSKDIAARKAQAAAEKTMDYQVDRAKKIVIEELPKAKGHAVDAVKKVRTQAKNTAEGMLAKEVGTYTDAAKKFLSKENIDNLVTEENIKKVTDMGKKYLTDNQDTIKGAIGGLGGAAGVGGLKAGVKKMMSKGAQKPVAPPSTMMQKANNFVQKNPAQVGLGIAGGAGALGGAYAMGKNNQQKTAFEIVNDAFIKVG
ncbi:MAG: hypothetical protein ACRCX2_28125 [Paraclostridium sp.]